MKWICVDHCPYRDESMLPILHNVQHNQWKNLWDSRYVLCRERRKYHVSRDHILRSWPNRRENWADNDCCGTHLSCSSIFLVSPSLVWSLLSVMFFSSSSRSLWWRTVKTLASSLLRFLFARSRSNLQILKMTANVLQNSIV